MIEIDSFDGLIFDCDGTLVDTMPTHFLAWKKVLGDIGIPFDEERFYSLAGVPTNVIVETLAKEQGVDADPHQVSHDKEEYFLSLSDGFKPIEEIASVAKAYYGKKPLGVATGTAPHYVNIILKSAGLYDIFGAVVSSQQVERPKPAPDVFLKAAELLNLKPEKCLAFEDSDLGLKSIEDAGMTAVDIRQVLEKKLKLVY